MCFPDDTAKKQAMLASADEKARQKRITAGTGVINSKFDMFNPGYFASRRKQFFEFGLPSVMENHRAVRDKTVFGLARAGHIGPGGVTSSTALDRMAALLAGLRGQRHDLMGRAFDFANRERGAIEGARSKLFTELRAGNDPAPNFNAADIAAQAYAANPPNAAPTAFLANLTGIGADAMSQPVDWRAMTAGLKLSPTSASSVRVVT